MAEGLEKKEGGYGVRKHLMVTEAAAETVVQTKKQVTGGLAWTESSEMAIGQGGWKTYAFPEFAFSLVRVPCGLSLEAL